MSEEANPPKHCQPYTPEQGAVTPVAQYNEPTFASDVSRRHSAVGASEPQIQHTIHLSPRSSEQLIGLNLPSEASSNSLQIDPQVSPSVAGGTSRRVSPAHHLKRKHEALKDRLQDLPISIDRTPRLPTADDFSHSLQVQIIPPHSEEDIKHVVILLHAYGKSDSSLTRLAWRLHKQQSETSFVLLRGFEAVPSSNSGYQWADRNGDENGPFLNTEAILTEMMRSSLMAACGFPPRNILLMGHGQGGMAALATAALWEDIELGGAVSIGGSLPSYVWSTTSDMVRTPALVVGGVSGDLNPFALDCIKHRFTCVDTWTFKGAHGTVPDSDESMTPLLDFLAHRLQREEWTKQAVISFDGGGIRGYGSLLILQELMNKIGDEEKRLDAKTESSFAPWPYKPVLPETSRRSSESSSASESSTTKQPVASDMEGLPNSSLFLPCHYFDYAAGTSTGGLISIMLSRLRMTVDDCITEYKTLGQKVFGNPRPLAFGAIMWHKFDHRVLRDVIQTVTTRHKEKSEEYELDFPSDEDLCRTLVMAYAEHHKTEAPYLFRTYYTPQTSADPNKTRKRQMTARNYGPPPKLPIWQIGRATSAAPKYFPPIKISKGVDHAVRFKDGGFGCNNPSEEAYHDIVRKHGGLSKAIGPFISIGTGVTPLDLFAEKSGHIPNALVNMHAAHKHPSRTLRAHDAIHHISTHDLKDVFPYYRFDGGKLLGEVDLDEWKSHRLTRLTGKDNESGCKTLNKMFVAVAAYLHRRGVQDDLNKCAKLLVKRRRLRARDTSAWDRYASASFYECSFQGCQKFHINTAQLFKEHVKKEHYSTLRADPQLEAAMKKSRRCWIYRNASQITK